LIFSIDGTVVATHSVSFGEAMRPMISDAIVDKGSLTVDWLTLTATAQTNVFDFSLSTVGNKSMNAGSSLNQSINASLTSGTTQQVSFSVSGLPASIARSFSSVSCSPNCSTILTLTAAASTAAGTFPIIVTAKAAGASKSISFNLTVISAIQTLTAPTLSPSGGSYIGSVSITMQTPTSGASIYYTTNGSTPTQSSALYTGPMTLTSTSVVKAKAFKSGYNPSPEASASFTITQPFNFSLSNSGDKSVNAGSSTTNTITATLVSGTSQLISFSVSDLPSGAAASLLPTSCNVNCDTSLSISTTSSTPGGSFPVTVTATGGGVTKTTTFTLSVTVALTVATPTISPSGGSHTGSVSVTMQTATPGASIYYTTTGSTPTQASTLYTGPMTLTSSAVVKAKAFKSGSNPSAEAYASFVVSPSVVSGSGKIYYVATNGNDANPGSQSQPFRNLKKAVSVLRPGDTLLVRQGTYLGSSQLYAIPSGTSWGAPVTIKAYPGETVTIIGEPSDHVLNLARNIHYVVFDGLILDAQKISLSPIKIHWATGWAPSHHIRVQNSTLKNGSSHGALIVAGGATDANKGCCNEFLNVKVYNNGSSTQFHHGFYFETSDNIIDSAEIYNNSGFGVHLYHHEPENNRNTVRNSKIWGHASKAGIIVGTGKDHKVYNNVIYNNADGIWITYGGQGRVFNNTIYGNGMTGILIDDKSPSSDFENNIISGHSLIGIHIYSAAAVHAFRNNLSFQNGSADKYNFLDQSNRAVKENNLFGNVYDARFANTSGLDFRIQSSSDARDRGRIVIESTTDAVGVARPQGAAYDIGAYEYVP